MGLRWAGHVHKPLPIELRKRVVAFVDENHSHHVAARQSFHGRPISPITMAQ